MALGQFTGGPRGVTRKIVVVTDEHGDIRDGGLTMAQVRQKAAALGATISVVMIDNSTDFLWSNNPLGFSLRFMLNDQSVSGDGTSPFFDQRWINQQIAPGALELDSRGQLLPLWKPLKQ